MQKQISFEVDYTCKSHSLKFTHVCLATTCVCQGKLCERCLIQYEEDHQNSNILTYQNYFSKIIMETQIFQKQYEFQQSCNQSPSQSLGKINQKFNELSTTQVYVLENSMKFLNQETKVLFRQISQKELQFTRAYQSLNVQKKTAHVKYFKQVQSKHLVDYCIGLYSQSGWSKFKAKMQKMMSFKNSILNFLQTTANYGKDADQFIKVNSIKGESSIKDSIIQLLNSKNSKNSSSTKSKNSQNSNSPQKRKRAKTIFGKN